MKANQLDKTQFLNVDLDVRSKWDLQPLVAAMGKEVVVLHVGRFKRTYMARLELVGSHLPRDRHSQRPEALILRFCTLILKLKPKARSLWNSAKIREFDIGIESGRPSRYYWFELSVKALRAVVDVDAKVSVTVYGPIKAKKPKRKSSKSASRP